MQRRRTLAGRPSNSGATPGAILPFYANAMRYLKFDGTDQVDQRRYALIQLSFSNSARQNSARDLATIADLIRSVNAIGTIDATDDDKDDARDPNTVKVAEDMLRLKDDGGTVKLEVAEYRMLLELIDGTRWRPTFALTVADLKDWLKRARKDRAKVGDAVDESPE